MQYLNRKEYFEYEGENDEGKSRCENYYEVILKDILHEDLTFRVYVSKEHARC